jgi:hypothetical protein
MGTRRNTGSTLLPAAQKVFQRLDHQYSFGSFLSSHEKRVGNCLLSSLFEDPLLLLAVAPTQVRVSFIIFFNELIVFLSLTSVSKISFLSGWDWKHELIIIFKKIQMRERQFLYV